MADKDYASIPEPTPSSEGLYTSVSALKQTVDVLTGQTSKRRGASVVTWEDLVSLGLITASQIPTS